MLENLNISPEKHARLRFFNKVADLQPNFKKNLFDGYFPGYFVKFFGMDVFKNNSWEIFVHQSFPQP